MSHPCQDDLDTTPFQMLSFAEQYTLWSIRTWTLGARTGKPVHHFLVDAFERLECPEGPRLVGDFMDAVARGASREIAVNCPRCRDVTMDERVLLRILAMTPANGMGGLVIALPFTRREHRAAVLLAGQHFAVRLLQAGLALPLDANQMRPEIGALARHHSDSAMTVH